MMTAMSGLCCCCFFDPGKSKTESLEEEKIVHKWAVGSGQRAWAL